ncbi:MAG: hypothetical protein FWG50_05890 [Kiritimatiellaeota bacterium]|nr:hypothetical protein [Kiritimatiellota bacterium]
MKSTKRLAGLFALAVVLIAVLAGLWMRVSKPASDEFAEEEGLSLVQIITTRKTQAPKKGAVSKGAPSAVEGRQGRDAGSARYAGNDPDDSDDEEDTPEEKALKRWEDIIAVFYEETEDDDDADDTDAGGSGSAAATTPNAQPKEPRVTLNDQLDIRDAFREMSEENRMEEVHHAMNLLPDESVEVMYGVLFDKTQPEDIMDVIFSDILNRDEGLKIHMLREIAKDKDHPLYAIAAHILEVTDDE